ncbi:MAG TPA: hypothetical protein VN253_17700 [Kofleriaceae bacterium]|nr:hypothetical protein [Kofleriaceae bacterium]
MRSRRSLISSAAVVAWALMAVLLAAPAAAEKPNPAFAGRIMLSDKRYPMSAKSLAAFNAQVTKQSKTSFFEDKDKKWKIYFAGFLKVPLNDVEYAIKLYELTGKGQQLLATIEQFSNERGQAALISNLVLDRKTVGVNKDLLMTIESKGKVLASSKFKVLGQADKFTGKVDFSEDEAAGKTSDE